MFPKARIIFLLIIPGLLSTPATGQSGSVDVELVQFGIGSVYRPGEIAAIRLKLTSFLDNPAPVWVQVELPNADGDIAGRGRSLTLTPGQPTSVWLYTPLSPQENANLRWPVRVFEEQDGQRGREIGGRRISPSDANAQRFDISTEIIGVIGRARMGLDGYAVPGPRGRPIAAHEETRIVGGIKPEDLPDRWFGLSQFAAIAWGESGQNTPNSLSLDQADALREYVMRGGHLIISLPVVGNPWGLGTSGQNPFEDLLPPNAPLRVENVPVSELRSVLSKSATVRSDITLKGISVFGKLGEKYDPLKNNYYEPVIALPDGRIVVIQRTYGFGRITISGIDVSDGQLLSLGILHADVFWNRILGRRMDTPSLAEQKDIDEAERLSHYVPSINTLGRGNLFVQAIQHDQSASVGIFLALLLFGIYWTVAFFSYYVLKQYKQEQHAWVIFAATAGLFTAIAWGAVSVLRPSTVSIKHVTVLDRIARSGGEDSLNPDRGDNDLQFLRAISYLSVYLPGYGTAPMRIDSTIGRDLLYSWEPPGVNVSKFQNVDEYTVDIGRNAAAQSLPTRATTTRLYANWMGSVDETWGGLLREDPDDPIHVIIDSTGTESSLQGTLINNFPGELTNVTMFWVKSQRRRPRRYFTTGTEEKPWIRPNSSGQQGNIGSMWRLESKPLLTGDRIVIEPTRGSLSEAIRETYNSPYRTSGLTGLSPSDTGSINANHRRNYLEMLSIFHQLTPPPYLKTPNQQADQQYSAFMREVARELDLSAWFTRPCLIVIGQLADSELPIPLKLDNDYESNGLTLIRWIFPLPLNEAVAFKNVREE